MISSTIVHQQPERRKWEQESEKLPEGNTKQDLLVQGEEGVGSKLWLPAKRAMGLLNSGHLEPNAAHSQLTFTHRAATAPCGQQTGFPVLSPSYQDFKVKDFTSTLTTSQQPVFKLLQLSVSIKICTVTPAPHLSVSHSTAEYSAK